MIFYWLGSLFLMLFSFVESQKQVSILFGLLQKKMYEQSLDDIFSKMLPRTMLVALCEASPSRSQQTALALNNLRILGKRASVLLMAMSSLGAWWVLILGLLFMNINGTMLLSVCVFLLVPQIVQKQTIKNILKCVMWTGLFLLGAELMLRNSASLQMSLGETEFAFALADGRLLTLLGLLLAAFLLSLFLQIEFAFFALSLVLVMSSVLALNGAIALMAGERMAVGFAFFWRGRGLNQDCKHTSAWLGLSATTGALISFFVALAIKAELGLAAGYGAEQGSERSLAVVLLLVVILFVQFVFQMTVGHFLVRIALREVQEQNYFPYQWVQKGLLSSAAMLWAAHKVSQRISEIRYHLQGLSTYKPGQIPDTVQDKLHKEEAQLTELIRYFR